MNPNHAVQMTHIYKDYGDGIRTCLSSFLRLSSYVLQTCFKIAVHDGLVHIRRNCISIGKEVPCFKGKNCRDIHDHEAVRKHALKVENCAGTAKFDDILLIAELY